MPFRPLKRKSSTFTPQSRNRQNHLKVRKRKLKRRRAVDGLTLPYIHSGCHHHSGHQPFLSGLPLASFYHSRSAHRRKACCLHLGQPFGISYLRGRRYRDASIQRPRLSLRLPLVKTAVVDTAGVEAKAEVDVGARAGPRAKARTEQLHPQHQEQKQHTHAPTIHNTTTIAANPAKITTSLSTSIRPKPNPTLTLHYGTLLSSPTPSSPTSHLYYKGFAPRSPILHDSRNSRCA